MVKTLASLALGASLLAVAAPATAQVKPNDTFTFSIAGFDTNGSNGVYLVPVTTATFTGTGVGQVFTFGTQVVTVTTRETMSGSSITDSISIGVPLNFIPTGTTNAAGGAINLIEFDFGEYNGGTDTLDFSRAVAGTPTYTGSVNYQTSSTLPLTPTVTLSNGNSSLAFYEAVKTTAAAGFGQFNIRQFNFSATYTPAAAAPVPEAATWAMMIAGFGLVGYAVRRRIRASEAAFDARIKQIAEGEIA